MRNSDFSWGKMQQKAFEDKKNEVCANALVQQYSLQKEATVTNDASEKAIGGFFFARRTSSHICIEKVDSSGAKLLEHRAESTGNCVCGHKIEAILSWKTIYPTDGPQTTQLSLCTRRRNPEDGIS